MTLARWSIIVLLVAIMFLLACAQAPTVPEEQRKQADQLRTTVGSLFECAQAARAYAIRAEAAEKAMREARASSALCL